MAVSPNYRSFVLEQLARVLPTVQARAMFGGVGIYSGAAFFALIDNDTLYFKVDDETRAAYERRGMPPFRPFGDTGQSLAYHEVPADVLEDEEALAEWATQALSVARRAKTRRRVRRG
jgi:DNA transformation protein